MFTGEEPLRTLAISCANPQEGKTTVTCNLAISLAQSGKRVLVVDTDMRRPRVHHAFGLSGKRGLTSMIVGEAKLDDVVQETVVANLWILACGPIPPNPAELLHRETFRALIEEARERYDLVIFDSPPLSAVADAAVLAPQLDGVLLVVRANRTTRDAIRSVLRQVRDVGARVVGGVLNGLDPRAKSEGGYYYYGRDGYYSSAEDDSGDPPAPPPDASPPRPQADAAE
jgi:capsular exopolysaccharide synthesis family protein